jgi:hypothetical protein
MAHLVVLLAGCADGGEGVRLGSHVLLTVQVSRNEPGPACQPLGALEGSSQCCDVPVYESAYAALQKNAAVRGGNYVVIDHIHEPDRYDSSYARVASIEGRLFSCPSGVAYARPQLGADWTEPDWSAPVVAPDAALCDPDCSPGFLCCRGACVSACNPACTAGRRCGDDRLCH